MQLNLEAILKELNGAPLKIEDDCITQRVYLGSCLDIFPSGKYYTPFANSNVTEEEAEADQDVTEEIEAELQQIDCYLESGEGDPTDLFIIRSHRISE